MKKVLLSAAALVAVLSSYAQCTVSSVDATGFYDDFSTVDQITAGDMGLYYWDDKTDVNGFTVAKSRLGDGVLGLTVTQGFDKFEPTGAGFGDDNGADPGGVLNTINLSGDATFSVDVKNTGDSTIKFRLALQDAVGGELDSYAAALTDAGGFANAWKYPIEIVVAPGTSGTLLGTFAGGTKADYGTGSYVNGFDFSKVVGVLITVVNSNQTPAPGYQTYGLDAQTVEVSNFKVGACPVAVGLTNTTTKSAVSVYPNPASEKVSFSKSLTDVTVFNALGNVIETAATSAGLNVSNYNAGIYFIKSAEGTTQFVVK